jgi:hypothetical protein
VLRSHLLLGFLDGSFPAPPRRSIIQRSRRTPRSSLGSSI